MRDNFFIDLQLFADGASGGTGGGDGAGVSAAAAGQPGENSAAAGQSVSLESLGVPQDKAEKYRARKKVAAEPATAPKTQKNPQSEGAAQPETVAAQQAAAAQDNTGSASEKVQTAAPLVWDEVMKDPEINKKMQQTVAARVKGYQSIINQLTPAMELLGKKYGIDTSDMAKFDYEALANAVGNDESLYEGIAKELGVNRSTAKAITQREQKLAARERAVNETMQDQMMREHFNKMEGQAAELKQSFPSFDLRTELANPAFARMVSPGGGLTVEQAYYALHHREIEAAKEKQTAAHVAQALSNSVQSGRKLPRENGISGSASEPVTNKLYSQMTREERAEYKAKLQREAGLRR